jgi:protein-disulfide isomerase
MSSKVTPLLTVLLVIVSFLAGSMYTRVRILESDEGKVQPGTAKVTVAPQQEEPEPVVLGEQDRAEIEEGGAAEKGDKNAKVTIVEFSEYECPYCQRYIQQAYTQIMDEYGDKIRYVFHDYPLEFHQHAKTMANVARCAGEQNKYWQMHDLLFANRNEWAEKEDVTETVVGYADTLDLDAAGFRACVTNDKYGKEVQADFTLGQKVGVSGTPTFYINGRQLVGAQPYAAFKVIIDEELGK